MPSAEDARTLAAGGPRKLMVRVAGKEQVVGGDRRPAPGRLQFLGDGDIAVAMRCDRSGVDLGHARAADAGR